MNKTPIPRGYGKSSTLTDLLWENTMLKQQNTVLLEYAKCKYFGDQVPWILLKEIGEMLEKLRDR